MSKTHVSPKQPNRVYVRKFDHEEARARYQAGEMPTALARQYGVTPGAVWNVVSEAIRAGIARREELRQQAGRCDRCGGPMHQGSRYNGSRRCRSCADDDQATSVRPHVLRCVTCRKWKPDKDFPSNRSESPRRRGRHSQCSSCHTVARREHRRRNREADNAYQRAYKARRRAEQRAAAQAEAEDPVQPQIRRGPSA